MEKTLIYICEATILILFSAMMIRMAILSKNLFKDINIEKKA